MRDDILDRRRPRFHHVNHEESLRNRGGPGANRSFLFECGRGRAARELPPASFAALVNSLVTQSLFYLGELSPQGTEPAVNLDMAKHQVDTLAVLEDKTKGNLSEEEQRLLDTGLYETRNRYIAVASQYI